MAKGKPNLAFLEALNKDKRRRGDPAPGGVFKTPAWFNKGAGTTSQPQSTVTAVSAMGSVSHGSRRRSPLITARIAASAMAVLIVAMGAFIIFNKQTPPKLSASSETVRSAPPQANVMDVPSAR